MLSPALPSRHRQKSGCLRCQEADSSPNRLAATLGSPATELRSRHLYSRLKDLEKLDPTAEESTPYDVGRAATRRPKFRRRYPRFFSYRTPITTPPPPLERSRGAGPNRARFVLIGARTRRHAPLKVPAPSSSSSRATSALALHCHIISKLIHVILDGDNYSLWAQGMCSFLKGRKLWLYVTGQRHPPTPQKDETEDAFALRLEDWDGTISEEALGHVVGMTTAREQYKSQFQMKIKLCNYLTAWERNMRYDYSHETNENLSQALVSTTLSDTQDNDPNWYTDTGATSHMTYDKGTPEQNGIAERKHRHIVETGLTMLLHAQLPKYLWVDAFTTAVYLINRLPSSVIQMQTPFYKLYGTHPTYASLKLQYLQPLQLSCLPAPLLEQIPIVAAPVTAPADTSSPPAVLLPSQVVPPVLTSSDTSTASNIHTVPLDPQTVSPAPASSSTPHEDLVSSVATPASHGSATSTPPSSTPELYVDLLIAPLPHAPPISTNTSSDDNMNVVGSRWVFKTKLKSDGSIDRFKARLVAQGYSQSFGIDFLETFSPVIKPQTIRLVLSLALIHGWSLRQLDVKNAFLHGSLKEVVYMEQPPGFSNSRFPNHVCRLHKALYGLKQAPRAWFDRFSSFLLTLGFKCSTADSSLFIFRSKNVIILLLVYVDDIIVTSNTPSVLSRLVSRLSSEFSMKDLGPLHYFLGIEVIPFSGGLFLSQQKYARDILARSSMTGCNPIGTPLAQKHNLRRDDPILVDATNYRSIVGALQYITLTRPDLTHAVNMALIAFLGPQRNKLLFQDLVQRQNTASMSTTTAELTWILYLLRDIGINLSTPPVLFCDNTSALHLTVNPVFHARTKHIELDVHFVREKVAAGALVTRFVPTHLQIADVFTKALSKDAFQRLRSKLGVMLPPTSSLRGSDKVNKSLATT
uniref:Integrase catalytic domain-containing protein n=1 Tax=Fagus sylvatica TaxID=28930 RepID=A0A2N9GBB0_FAGSY